MDGIFFQKSTGTKNKTLELLANLTVKLQTNEQMDFVSCFIAIKADAMLVQTTFAEVWNHPKFGEKSNAG